MSYPIGSLDLEQIKDTIYSWVSSVTQGVFQDDEEHILWRNQSEPLPARPCIALKFIDGPRPIARDPSRGMIQQGTSPNFQYVQQSGIQYEAQLSVQVFGNTRIHRPLANQLAVDVNASLMLQSVLDQLKAGGVSVQEVGHPRNLTALEETEYEERAGFELTLGMVQNVSEIASTIETVNADILDQEKTFNLP